jgi:plastocyanin
MKRGWIPVATSFALLAMSMVSAGRVGLARAAAPAAAAVSIDNFSFTPREITVAKGTTVTWTNRDDVPHTVVSPDKAFRSKALDTDDQFSFTFQDAGTYSYFCSVHPMMTGKVIVK